jgi:hypothetical protein
MIRGYARQRALAVTAIRWYLSMAAFYRAAGSAQLSVGS